MPVRRPQQKRSVETRARILSEARRAFAANGFEATNVRDVAESAGTTHSMIRYHFGSKDRLWREAVSEMFAILQAEVGVEPDDPSQSNEDRLKSFLYRYIRYCARHPEHAWITIQETITGGERLDWMVKTFVKAGHNRSIHLLQDLMDEGILPQTSPILLIYTIVGMAQLPFVLAKEAEIAFGADMLSDEMIQQHTESVIRILMRRPDTA